MIIILEGVNGVGKSACAKILSNKLDIKSFRPLKFGNSDLHWNENGLDLKFILEGFKVPTNSHVEDVYTADFLSSFQVDAILDRTLTSSIAYGRTYVQDEGWYKQKGNSGRLLDFWQSIMMKCKPKLLYVWMEAPYDVILDRCKNRWCPKKSEYEKLCKEFEQLFRRIRFDKIRLDAHRLDIDQRVKKILDVF